MTSSSASARPHVSYRHEAFLYRDDQDFLDGVVPFVRDAIAAAQPVMVAVRRNRADPLRDVLGPDAVDVHFVDMAELGQNPARIIPGWRRFLDEHCLDHQPVRGVGEPIWSDRKPGELLESQLHEALLNVAVQPDTPLWLRCPYDVGALSPAAIAEASRSHPVLVETGGYQGSRTYGGMQHVEDLFAGDLPEPAGPTDGILLPAVPGTVSELVFRHARLAGVDAERTWSLSLAIRETTAGAMPGGALRVWSEPGALVCEISDPTPLDDPMAGRRRPHDTEPDHRGLWLANQMCDLVQVRSSPQGSTIRIVTWR